MKLISVKTINTSLILCLMATGLLSISTQAAAASVGDMAPDFEISTQDGNLFRLSDFRGHKPVYVIFWNTWCEYCVKKTPRYSKLLEQLGDQIEIIAINTSRSDSVEEMRAFEKQYDVAYLTAFDNDELVSDQYEVPNVPTEFIVDLDGVIRYRDRVPEYLAAHLPDWLLPYVPSNNPMQLACLR